MAALASPRIDVRRFVHHLGGPTVLQRKIAVLGYSRAPTVDTIRKWMSRGSLTSEWLATMMALARAEGRPVDLYQFLEVPE